MVLVVFWNSYYKILFFSFEKKKRKRRKFGLRNWVLGRKMKGCISERSGPLETDGGDGSRIAGGKSFSEACSSDGQARPDGRPR
mgnify:CR=1 FL=1